MNNDTTATPGPPLWLLAEVTYACPLHCAYCSNPVNLTAKQDEIDLSHWLRVLTEAREMGAVQLGFSGGEPLLRKDLEQMVAHASELGFYTNLITSGIGLTEKRLAKLKEAGLDHIQLSFQAANAETNDLIGNRRHAFANKLEVAKLIKQYDYPMVLNFCLTAQNIDQIDDVLALSCELDADFVELATVQYYGWAYVNRDQLLPTQQALVDAEAKVNAFRAQQQGKGPKFIFVAPDYYDDRPKACMNGWGSTFLTVAPDGAALPCHSAKILPMTFPNVQDKSLADIWYQDFSFNQFRGTDWLPSPCAQCDEKEKDFGGCRCQAYMLTGDMFQADPVCAKSPHHHTIEKAIAQSQQEQKKALVLRDPKNSIDVVTL
ncbi:pyrroloquinoline quinone biosynthesis protein PqqE [Alteromonas sp. C1M14]|uniref:pyrroloquinoline quinone biosynthesis protein PqqE n=1 Tax=Alteromonas sp. C1M14 TaxID=2841567 RepID=UPI001C089723|nr:pyrroloquinoline quinone biosynthesis protein PqqE [Alteromonas sp. C1M14]MBU2979264.1 pyrroloquinoline quinone biosynthesis protein PqqE [Alteromonas sp. C1M14]